VRYSVLIFVRRVLIPLKKLGSHLRNKKEINRFFLRSNP